jgi:hypothetical protein
MDRTFAARIFVGLAVVGQAVCFAVVVAVIAAAALAHGGELGAHLALSVAWLVALTLAGTLLCSAALPVLVRHAQELPGLDDRTRRRWLVRLALWGPVTMPLYWRRYVRG